LDGIDELADSLRAHGLLQPIVVRRLGGTYELIAGHRRLEAARLLGWTEIAAVVRDDTDDQAYILTLVENLQREDLTPKEEAAALEVLVRERGWTTRQVGEAIKRSHIYVSRRLRVFDDPVLAPLVLQKALPVSTAEELLRVADTDERIVLARRAAEEGWERVQVRAALEEQASGAMLERNQDASWNAAFRKRLDQLARELDGLDRADIGPQERRVLKRLSRSVRRLTHALPSGTGGA
jgi:ParB family chromosome partitioning protein